MDSTSSYWDSFSDKVDAWYEHALESYSKSSVSDSVDKGLAVVDPKTLGAKVDSLEDSALNAYSHSSLSDSVDSGIDVTKPVTDAVNKYLGYFSEPENITKTLETLKWVLIAGGIIYVLVLVSPAIRAAMGSF